MKIEFTKEKETKNTIRFMEITDEGEAVVGTIYIPKTTLKEIGWSDGKVLEIELSVK